MTRARRWGWTTGWAAGAVALLPLGLAGQERLLPPPALVFVAGGLSYEDADDISGTATVFGLRADLPLSRFFTLEPGLERIAWTDDPEADENADPEHLDEIRWTIDFALHAEYGVGRTTPYVGGNIGVALDFDQDREFDEQFVEALYGGHGGLRVEVVDRIELRGEVRGRWYDRFRATWISYVGGVSWRF